MNFRPHHTSFTVSDMDRSIAFYRDQLGLPLLQDVVRENMPAYDVILGMQDVKIRIAIVQLSEGGHLLELIEYLNPRREVRELKNYYVGAAHLCFIVDDLENEYRRLSDNGTRFTSPPTEIVRDGKYIGKGLYMLDPDGITIELLELPS